MPNDHLYPYHVSNYSLAHPHPHPRGDPGAGAIPVYRFVVSLVRNNLGRQVVGRAAEGPCLVGHSFRKAKIRDLEVAVPVEQQVFWLQITIYDVAFVEVFES